MALRKLRRVKYRGGVIRSSLLTLLILTVAATAQARTETFRWLDPNPLPSPVTSFHIYWGTSSGDYTMFIDVGLPTPDENGVFSASTDVPDDAIVYVAMTAKNVMNLTESGFSNEIVIFPVGSTPTPTATPTPTPTARPQPEAPIILDDL